MFKVAELVKAAKGKLTSGKENIKVKGISIDSRTLKPGECFVAIKGDNFDGHDFIEQAIKREANCIIVRSQGHPSTWFDFAHRKSLGTGKAIPRLGSTSLTTGRSGQAKSQGGVSIIEVKDTIIALGDIARFWRNKFNIPVIAVTGSNGKTTSKEMIAWVLSAKFKVLKNEGTKNNHIGLPMALLNLNSAHQIAVLEIGTNHFGEVANLANICSPNIGVITNIGPSHLKYFHNLEGVLREKYSLFDNLKSPGIGILNADDPLLRGKISGRRRSNFIASFGINQAADFSARCIKRLGGKISFSLYNKYKFTLATPGYYNTYNALAAIAAGRIFGIEDKDIAKRLAQFRFPCGRLNFVTVRKIRFLDDTYNANPASLAGALDALVNFKAKGRKICVLGDMLELGSGKDKFHSQAGEKIVKACDCFIAVGKLSRLAAQAARERGLSANNIFNCRDSLQARRILFNKLSPCPKDIILVKGSRAMKMEEVLKI